MAKDISDHIDVAGFVVKGCTISSAELMRRELFGKAGVFAVFFYHVLDASD